MSKRPFYPYNLDEFIHHFIAFCVRGREGVVWGGIAKSVDPYQTPPVAASDNGLHCLQMSLLCDVWVKDHFYASRLMIFRC